MKESEIINRPEFIKNWKEMLGKDDSHYTGSEELLSIGAPMGKLLGLKRIGINFEVLPPGRRTSWPHAEKTEEEFIFVLKGTPHAWINGEIFLLQVGDAVAFPTETGIAHTFINNSKEDVHLLVIGDQPRVDNKAYYPLHPERNQEMKNKNYFWENYPPQKMGAHNGLPD